MSARVEGDCAKLASVLAWAQWGQPSSGPRNRWQAIARHDHANIDRVCAFLRRNRGEIERLNANPLIAMVGAVGIEPTTSPV